MHRQRVQWAVVGAGPAGIAAVGKLLDKGVAAEEILWIDPHFQVGDLGLLWQNVSSNTTVRLFIQFLQAVKAFHYESLSAEFDLARLAPEETCLLKYIAEPLQAVTARLKQQVQAVSALVHEIHLHQRLWHLHTDTQVFQAGSVILATGAVPSVLNYAEIESIPFEIAIDKARLAQVIESDKTYAVFGSSHSAIIMVQSLVELGVKKVVNFYRSPCVYAVPMGDWILFDNTGLKGQTAAWAREHIDGQHPTNLQRYTLTEANIARYLPDCHKAIYAVGFKRRSNILMDHYEHLDHNPHVGIIAPGLFGFGIAYPELKFDPLGNQESQVGLWKFMVYLEKVLPYWLRYSA